jgi:uncharacterized damage-inducible protein DinB
MTSVSIPRPDTSEYAPYYGRYIGKVPAGELLAVLERQRGETAALLRGIPEAKATHRYAPGKWSIKEVIGHISDSERIFSYRALRFARGDRTPLPGFEQDDYMRPARFDARPLAGIAAELDSVRLATLALFRGLDAEALARRGEASGKEVSVRALAWIIAGHTHHHVEILRERYLAQ